jgi:hypothetical protein
MSLFVGARVGIGRELGEDSSHHELLCDFAGIEPSYYFAFSCLWSELHAAFNRELEANTISHAFHMIENQTPAIFEGAGLLKHHDVHWHSDVQAALLQRTFSPQLALSVISPTASLESSNLAPEVVPAVQQLQQSKRAFVNSAAKITGSRDLLVANWCQRMGGNLVKHSALAVVTGGGHTSEEVLSWMQVLVSMSLLICQCRSLLICQCRSLLICQCRSLRMCRRFSGENRPFTRITIAFGKIPMGLLNFPA